MASLLTGIFLLGLAWTEWRHARVRRLLAGKFAYQRFFQLLSAALALWITSVLLVGGWVGTAIAVGVFSWRLNSYANRALAFVAANIANKESPSVSKELKFLSDFKKDELVSLLAGTSCANGSLGSPTAIDVPHETVANRTIVNGENIDTVRFDYVNAKGEFSSRRLKVTMVGQWEFEGIDLDKHEHRTFKHNRVVGDITSENTGEIIDPHAWAASLG